MKEYIFNIACLFGIMILIWRISIFVKVLVQLIKKTGSEINISMDCKVSELQNINFTDFRDSEQ